MNLYADLLFTGGAIYTADPARPWAAAVAVRDGRILAVGSAADLAELQGPSTVVTNLAGKLLLPGFTESHVHFIELALRAAQVEATEARSAGEVVELVRAKLNPSGSATPARSDTWIRGGGWNANIWTDGVAPHRRAPGRGRARDAGRPGQQGVTRGLGQQRGVADSRHRRGHAGRAGWNHRTGCGRRAHRHPARERGGSGGALLSEARSGRDHRGRAGGHRRACGQPASSRCTTPTTPATAWRFAPIRSFGAAASWACACCSNSRSATSTICAAIGLRSGLGDAWLRVGGVKMFADGALGSRTASMLQPYVDEPNNWGVAATDPEEMLEQALAASVAGLSLTIHAIGDRANRDVLNVLAEVRKDEGRRTKATTSSVIRQSSAVIAVSVSSPSPHRARAVHPPG